MRYRACNGLDQRRLARAIAAQQTNPFTRREAQLELRDDDLLPIACTSAIHAQHGIGQALGLGKLKAEG